MAAFKYTSDYYKQLDSVLSPKIPLSLSDAEFDAAMTHKKRAITSTSYYTALMTSSTEYKRWAQKDHDTGFTPGDEISHNWEFSSAPGFKGLVDKGVIVLPTRPLPRQVVQKSSPPPTYEKIRDFITTLRFNELAYIAKGLNRLPTEPLYLYIDSLARDEDTRIKLVKFLRENKLKLLADTFENLDEIDFFFK